MQNNNLPEPLEKMAGSDVTSVSRRNFMLYARLSASALLFATPCTKDFLMKVLTKDRIGTLILDFSSVDFSSRVSILATAQACICIT